MATPDHLKRIPFFGSGVGYRAELKADIWRHRSEIDCLEIITDRYVEHSYLIKELEELADAFRVIPHGVGLSIGSPDVDSDYLQSIKIATDVTKAPYYSEHLCMTRAPHIDIGHLAPLWFTHESLIYAIDNVRRVQDTLGKPLILENTTYPFVIPEHDMTQAEFFAKLVSATECGVLLDVTNVRINAHNHQFNAVEFLEAMPLDHVVQLHIAGGFTIDTGEYIDGHCDAPDEAIWEVLAAFGARGQAKGAILEHDAKFPDDFSMLLMTLRRTREIMNWPTLGSDSAEPWLESSGSVLEPRS